MQKNCNNLDLFLSRDLDLLLPLDADLDLFVMKYTKEGYCLSCMNTESKASIINLIKNHSNVCKGLSKSKTLLDFQFFLHTSSVK